MRLDGRGCTRGVSSHDQRADLDRPVARLADWGHGERHAVAEVVREVGSGLNGKRPKLASAGFCRTRLRRWWSWKHRDRLARFGGDHLEAAPLSGAGRRIVGGR